jgi:putative phosphoesterase
MRIGLISDIHANVSALRAVLDALGEVDAILCAGDLTGYNEFPNEVIEEIQSRGVQTIAGNHDVYLWAPPASPNAILKRSIDFTRGVITPANLQFLTGLPCQRMFNFDGVRVAMYHGSPWDPQEEYIYPDYRTWERFAQIDADIVVLGHTHRPILRQIGALTVVNPGSVGQPRDGDPRPSYAVLETLSRKVELARVDMGKSSFQTRQSQLR